MTCMLNLSGRAINAKKFEETFGDIIPGPPSSIKRRGGISFPLTSDSLAMLKQQIEPVMSFLQNHKDEVQSMLAFDGVDNGSLDFGIRIDLEEIIFNVNNFLPLPLLRLAAEIGLNIELSFYFGSKLMSRSTGVQKPPRVECSLTFLTPEEGGRTKPLTSGELADGNYRPHLVVDDLKQRKEAVLDGAQSVEAYLGVAFREGPYEVHPGETVKAVVDLIYYPQLSYEGLQPGTLFTVREGPQIVAYGTVISRTA